MQIPVEEHTKLKARFAALRQERQTWWSIWRDLADYYLPRRYVWLLSPHERMQRTTRNNNILDPTGTTAARTLASGMMNGITSPSRPWFKLRAPLHDEADNTEVRVWLDEVTRRILLAMAETNFYNSMALMYLDLGVFGTAANLIYEDYDSVFRCYNCALGEYYLGQDERQMVNQFGREFTYKVSQMESKWGKENLTEQTRAKFETGGANLLQDVHICHIIEPNNPKDGILKGNWKFREVYWEQAGEAGQVLSVAGFNEIPGIFPRWELTANDVYGNCPAMDALADVIQLQHETKKKAQGLDKMVSPPIVADIQLAHKPMALLPNGVTYISGANNVGAKPVYTVQLPLDQLTADIRDVQLRIKEMFHNDLFRMISELDTVRSATEIDARREEKLVLLGPVLERFENEALDPAIQRIFNIMLRAGLLPEVPEVLDGADIEINYVSVLTSAQTAVATIPTERWIGLIGNIAPVKPEVLDIPDWDELIRNYGRDLGVRARDMKTREAVDGIRQAGEEQAQMREAAASGAVLAEGAKTLSETQVGGGANALQRLINPYG